MAEIILYKGKTLSLGTEMNLWHVSYHKLFMAYITGQLKQSSDANLPPEDYLRPDSVFRFRFPFPDEKDLPLMAAKDFDKRIQINITCSDGTNKKVFISQQQCISRPDKSSAFLATLYRDESGMEITRLDDILEAHDFTRQIVLNHILHEENEEKRYFFREVVNSILHGYCIDITL